MDITFNVRLFVIKTKLTKKRFAVKDKNANE